MHIVCILHFVWTGVDPISLMTSAVDGTVFVENVCISCKTNLDFVSLFVIVCCQKDT